MEFKPIANGPVTSRRFGKTIKIINCPESFCTYSCVYCHGGHTQKLQYERMEFFNPLEIVKTVRTAIAKSKEPRDSFDYITFIPDGEPTQDINLGKEIDLIKEFGIKTAVMTNSSLIWRPDVREELMKADVVSLKLDALDETLWKKTHRPHRDARFATIIDGIMTFAEKYKGLLLTETMLVKDHNDSLEHASLMASFLKKLKPSRAFISVPTNPPTETWVEAPEASTLNKFFQTIREKFPNVQYIIGYMPSNAVVSGNVMQDILNAASREPLSLSKMNKILARNNANQAVVKNILETGELEEVRHEGNKYFVRKYQKSK